MNALRGLVVGLLLAGAPARASEAFFDRVEERLTFGSADGQVRARLSGLLDLEGYLLPGEPVPGVIQTQGRRLFVPRLSVFLDAQLGSRVYVFAQARADRGFDPARADTEARLDEFAVRWAARPDRRLTLQAGKFATVVGSWAARHLSWANPFITAPVAYEQLTGIWDTEIVRSGQQLLQWSHVRRGLSPAVRATEKSLRVPILWGPSYATGAAVWGEAGHFRYAAEVKLGSLSSRPEAWLHAREQLSHPTVSGRLGYRPNPTWDFGVSASGGSYLREFAERTVPAGRGRGDYRQLVLAHDATFAWRHWQVWAEVFLSRFEIPAVGDADTWGYYVEAKYRFTPRFAGAVRWNEQRYGDIADRGTPVRWGRNVGRIDLAPSFRFSAHTQLKLQYSLQRGDNGPREYSDLWATQVTVRF